MAILGGQTHGGVTDENAHPHSSEDGLITVVHNGIIENANELSELVKNHGYQMSSDRFRSYCPPVRFRAEEPSKKQESIGCFCRVISTQWCLVHCSNNFRLEGILISRNGAPMVIGRGIDGFSISSDALPFYGACSEIAYMSDGDNFLITRDRIISPEGSEMPIFEPLEGIYDEQDPGVYENMMMKEIHDQPVALSNVLGGRISSDGGSSKLSGFELSPDEIRKLRRINLVACGTAYYAALLGARIIRNHSNVTVEAFRSSEFPIPEFPEWTHSQSG